MSSQQQQGLVLNYERDKARVFLGIACLWPFLLMALFASSSPRLVHNQGGKTTATTDTTTTTLADDENSLRFNLRNVLDRVDIMGYGPTHPRIGVVVTGDATKSDKSHWVATVESVFSHTDLSRIFVVTVVVDGKAPDPAFERDLKKIHNGEIPHLHGLRLDMHTNNDNTGSGGQQQQRRQTAEQQHQQQHESKVHVMFNEERMGITASRQDGVEFVHILAKHHESAGLKSHAEDIILVLLHAGTVLTSRRWLPTVTQSLIVPPPLLPGGGSDNGLATDDTTVSLKLANAVAFNIEGPNKRTTFDSFLTPRTESANSEELNQSNGASYMAPVWNGAALALRLETYRQLPMHDEALTEAWPANLDLSLALWLCADGIDMVTAQGGATNNGNGADADQDDSSSNTHDALAVKLVDPKLNPTATVTAPLPPFMAARFAEAWMDEVLQRKFFHWYTHTYHELTYLEWQTFQAQARQSPSFVGDLARKCRSMQWYINTINPEYLQPLLEQSAVVDHRPKPEKETNMADPVIAEEQAELAKEHEQRRKREEQEQQKQQPAGNVEQKNENNGAAAAKEEEPVVVPPRKEEEQNKDNKNENPEDEESVAIPARREPKKPSKPLCDECLKIVEQAKPMSVEKVDMAGGHKEHPHLGAKDANGNLGYIHDETHLRRNPPSFNMDKDQLNAACTRRDNNYRMLTEKVFVDLKADQEAQEVLGEEGRVKLFCLVYTTAKGHVNIPRIRETWGQKCDGFMVGSTKTDPDIDTVEIPHEGPEEYNNIWQKVRSMWAYIYDNYYDKYDWFHIGGDDYYLLVENLRLYLESEEIRTATNGGIYLPDGSETSQVPMFLGRRFAYMGDMNDIFNSGGSGYTINKAALKTLVVEGLPNFRPHAQTFSEDTVIARMFKKHGILPYDTKDEQGGERYMPFMPGHHYGYRMPADKSKDWYAKYSINIKTGADHCAARSVAFHYVKDNAMYRLHAILYNLCPAGTL